MKRAVRSMLLSSSGGPLQWVVAAAMGVRVRASARTRRGWPLVCLVTLALGAVACSDDGEVDDETLVAACEAMAEHVAGLDEARNLMNADILDQELAALEATRDEYGDVDEVQSWLDDLAIGGEFVAEALEGDGGTDARLAIGYLDRGRADATITCAEVDVDIYPGP